MIEQRESAREREWECVCVCVCERERERENGRVPISTWMYFLNGSSTAARSFVIFISILIMEEKFEIFSVFFNRWTEKDFFSFFSLSELFWFPKIRSKWELFDDELWSHLSERLFLNISWWSQSPWNAFQWWKKCFKSFFLLFPKMFHFLKLLFFFSFSEKKLEWNESKQVVERFILTPWLLH